MAKSDVTRTILETTISQALRDMARDPARTMRKLVDLGRHFSHGRFQKHFFALAQTMLAHEDSAYYPLMARVAAQVEHQHLKTFGINLGYNGCTNGAKLIRENEARLGFNIPWAIAFAPSAGQALTPQAIDAAIAQGKALGVYTYLLLCERCDPAAYLSLLRAHEGCAFFLFCRAEALDAPLLDALMGVHNTMVSVATPEGAWRDACNAMHARRMLYGAHTWYDRVDEPRLLSGDWARDLAPSACVFAMMLARPACPDAVCARIARYALETRTAQAHPLVLIDVASDMLAADRIISDDACAIAFGASGAAYMRDGGSREDSLLNICQHPLQEILQRAFPKAKAVVK